MGRKEVAGGLVNAGVAGMVVWEGLTAEVAFEQNPVGGREPLHRKLGGEHSRQKVQRP